MKSRKNARRPRYVYTVDEGILIPKHLRLEWTDAMMLDPELHPTVKAAGGVVGHHFNRRSGETFLSQDTIARFLGVSDRTVQTAIKTLEAHGYLIVKRRLIKKRELDGKCFFGGRGMANVYAPAFCGQQISRASNSGLLERIEKFRERGMNDSSVVRSAPTGGLQCPPIPVERSKCDDQKNETSFVPTLSNPTDCNPSIALLQLSTAMPAAPHPLGDAYDRIRDRIGDPLTRAWIAELTVLQMSTGVDGVLLLGAGSTFRAGHVQAKYGEVIRDCYNQAQADSSNWVTRVRVEVRP